MYGIKNPSVKSFNYREFKNSRKYNWYKYFTEYLKDLVKEIL